MSRSRLARLTLVSALLAAVAFTAPNAAYSQKRGRKKDAPHGKADDLLKPKPRPKRPALPPSKLPLEFLHGERIAFIGNSTAERMNLFGHFEALLHTRFPDKELVVRNFARPTDEVSVRQRPTDYTHLDDPIFAFEPDTFLCFFGWNESFAGPAGVEKFQADYERFLDEYAAKYPRDDAKSKPRFVLISPIAFEPTGDKLLPDGTKENANLKLYTAAVKAVADKRKLAFVDLFAPTEPLFAREPGMQFTINGVHVNETGDREVSTRLDRALFGTPNPAAEMTARFEKLRAAVNDKSWVHLQDYRMLNGWYVYGSRRTWDLETFPREFLKIRNMAAVRDRYVWDIAQGKEVAAKPDDSHTGQLVVPPTRFGEPRQKYSEADTLRYLTPDQLIKSCTVPPGFEIKLFADEKMFPEIAKPVQLNFDNKGRLWVCCMPTYPLWKPGDPKPADKLVILEDTDGDGKADKSTVFYDKLHCPTGFEFFRGGVLVVDQPRLVFLKDTDGDDRADQVTRLIDGWATDDTHHTVGAFEFDNGGRMHMLEGLAVSTAVETPWGPFRNFATPGCYVLDPRALKVSHFVTPGYGNPWCYVYNQWGQGIVGDGTGASQHWDTPLSGAQYTGRKGLNPVFDTERLRPVVGSEFLVSRQFPDDVQGQFIYACVINMNGMPRWTIKDDGAGYKGIRVRHDPNDPKTAYDLIRSTDKHFRPVDPQIGPDGALWFGDWANALIGHMQYSQRDPNRDHQLGRIYRLVYTGKPLLKPVTQFGKPAAEILEQFREYEWRTRYRARRELHDRPDAEVLPAVQAWASKIDPTDKDYDRLRCEALWVQQGHHAVDPGLLSQALASKTPDARAAATRIVADERDTVPNAFELLTKMASDPHPRVRTEAVRGLSYFPTMEAARAVLPAASSPDYWVKYTAEAALGANESVWRQAFLTGQFAKDDPAAKKALTGLLAASKAGAAALPYLQQLLSAEPKSPEQRDKALRALADMHGNATNGRQVFVRNCTACHQVGNGEGHEYGPNLQQVATRLKIKQKIVESVLDPNAEVDPKFLSTRIDTLDGKTITGLVVSENKQEVVIFDGKEKKVVKVDDIDRRTALKQSSMPEGLGGSISPAEFLDLIEYLSGLK
ncbi:MAG TPA: PVC-type heme-binding CxxCH protein [Fimbriiglobus sp.]|nr:PVC-type heme-binding CxxCH protein [Fimbriiglobus sp.]